MSSNSFSFNNSAGSNSLRKKSKVNIEEYPYNSYNNSWNTVGMSFTEPLNSTQQKRYDISQRVQQTNPIDFDDSLSAFTWKNFLKFSGPGWLMSIAYLDPGNLESDLQASALCGNKLVWVLFWSHVLGFFFQNLASRLGVVTGKDLSQHIRKQYPNGVKNLLWFMTEAAIIGSDIQEVIGTAIALYILLGIPFWLGVIVTIVDTMTFLLLQQYGMRKLELFFISLILVMGSCFVAELFLTDIYVESIISGLLLPTIPPKAMVQTAGMIGAVIMPHNIYLHSGLVSRRNINRLDRNGNEVKIANQFFLVENASALLVSFLINLSIMAVFSQVFYYSKGEVPSTNVGLVDASYALSASLGSLSKYLWAIGLLAAGQCSTMTGTLAGQYVMEGFWKYTLDPWKRILFTRSLAIIPSIITTIVAADYLDVLGEYLNALQSLQLPFAIIPLLKFTYDIKLMGPKFVNSRTSQLFYIFIVGVIVCINMFLIYQLAHQWAIGSIFNVLLFWTTFLGYLYCIYKVVKLPHNYNFD